MKKPLRIGKDGHCSARVANYMGRFYRIGYSFLGRHLGSQLCQCDFPEMQPSAAWHSTPTWLQHATKGHLLSFHLQAVGARSQKPNLTSFPPPTSVCPKATVRPLALRTSCQAQTQRKLELLKRIKLL